MVCNIWINGRTLHIGEWEFGKVAYRGGFSLYVYENMNHYYRKIILNDVRLKCVEKLKLKNLEIVHEMP